MTQAINGNAIDLASGSEIPQNVADTFAKAGVIPSRVNVAPLWDGTFTDAINKCK